jgi:type IV secretion system protein VirB9
MRHLHTLALAAMVINALAPDAMARPRSYSSLRRAPAAAPVATANVAKANDAARIQPMADSFQNANQVYAFADGALFEVYATLGKVTDIALEPGEVLVGNGPVAAGDTVRWIIGDTVSGAGAARQAHILVKPTHDDIATNLVINTDRRTYHIELQATPHTYMAVVSWRYPQDALIALQQRHEQEKAQAPVVAGLDPTKLSFAYRIDGDRVSWRPVEAFDDGEHVYIVLPQAISTDDLPPLFITGADGKAELVNYRVTNRVFIVDRLFNTAELRMGDKFTQKIVRIRHIKGAHS